jgi:hypothetical protein
MSDVLDQLTQVGNDLDVVDIDANPDKARALLRRRKELTHQMERNRENGFSHRRRVKDQRPSK